MFASAFHALGLGKLVGVPTGGHVIGTGSTTLIDGSTLRIPRTGVYTLKGVNMEKSGVEPDVHVENQPDQLAKGVDSQLEKAVHVLMMDVARAKQGKTGVSQNKASPIPPGASAVTPPTPSLQPSVPQK